MYGTHWVFKFVQSECGGGALKMDASQIEAPT